MKLAILSPTNLDFMAAELKNLGFETYTAPYGQVVVEALNSESNLYAFTPDVVVVFYDAADVLGSKLIRPFDSSENKDRNAFDEIESTVAAITSHSPSAQIVLNTIPLPARTGMGRLDQHAPAGLRTLQNAHNAAISTLASETPQVVLHDYAALAESHGLNDWYDTRMWYLARARLARNSTSALAADISALLTTSNSPRAKVIVVDLDNTCWGGIVGDDGINGITLGADGPGLAFASFQQALLNYRDQGILLAIASKNDVGVVHNVFDSHPGMILTRDDISSWQVHWDDKAISIQRISEELDLGADSFVFFDDNPVERLRVSETHPDVTVIDVPSDPAGYVDALFASETLNTTTLTTEDLVRPAQYQARNSRTSSSKAFTDVRQFLESLEMKVEISENLDHALPRIAQLTQKTNQFNLRTQRYSEADITKMIADGSHRIFWLQLTDRFGDEGIVAIAIVRTGSDWFIDTLLMSCRVLNRGIEQVLIRHLKSEAKTSGAGILRGEFIATGRNDMVRDLLPSMDFHKENEQWVSDTSTGGPNGLIELDVTTTGPDS
jgi:FkbH-like protein